MYDKVFLEAEGPSYWRLPIYEEELGLPLGHMTVGCNVIFDWDFPSFWA